MDRILITQSAMPPFEEYAEEIKDLWDSHWITNMGAKHKALENKLCDYLDVDNIELVVNGHMALEMTLQAMELSGEVITTPYTFASTTHAIVRNGLTPVFCDINPEDYTIDVNKIEALITDKTSAILPVHVYGNICDVERIDEIAKKYNLKVIYDAAHSFGETYKGAGVGSFGDASIFSFHATKVFNTIEGGAVCFKDEKIGKKIYDLKNFGIHGTEVVSGIGANAKMNEFSAAMGLCNLRHIDDEISARKKLTERYRELLGGVKGLKLMSVCGDVVYNYAYFPVVFDADEFGKTRDEVYDELRDENIFSRKYFYPITSDFDCYKGSFNPLDTPTAYEISKNILCLPLYGSLGEENVDKICKIILKK
ncbi:MAG: DegT/DnrJ/EryC1/StrS family aminotransferase [Ruminococcus sp.]|nr:DegT/DnrJ/EryC1/StrS family aminotransferase [Ruminococcus sp.]